MDDGSPTLEVGFAIDAGGSYETLTRLENGVDKATASIIAEIAKIEKATGGMLKLGGATASITSFGNATTKVAQDAARELSRIEKSGESLSGQLERQIATFGKTRDEIRALNVETRAAAAEQQGLTELAGRLRSQLAGLTAIQQAAAEAAQIDARAMQNAAAAHQAFEMAAKQGAAAMREVAAAQKLTDRDAAAAKLRVEADATAKLTQEHARLAAEVRASHAAQEADHASLERLRMATDPLYAATKRLNDQIAESTRLYHAGITPQSEYARQQKVLTGALEEAEKAHLRMAGAARKSGFAVQQVALQMPDIVGGLLTGQKPMTVFIQQGFQIAQVAQMAEGGIKGFAAELGVAAIAFAPLIATLAVAGGAFLLFQRAVTDGIDTKSMINSLGLTRAEIKRLKDTTVTTGDVIKASFQVLAKDVGISLDGIGKTWSEMLDYITGITKIAMAATYAAIVGTLTSADAAAKAIAEGKSLKGVGDAIAKAYTDPFDKANTALSKLGGQITAQIKANKLADLQKQAAEIKLDRTPKKDRHAEQLAREAAAMEAQIKNTYALAQAYKLSGGEALIAEARVKAESEAIKKRADITAAVDRQIRLAIAERVKDGEKSATAIDEQARVQEQVNAMVEAGLVPAERANQLVQERMALLPLLGAIEAAEKIKDRDATVAAQRALDDYVAAQARAKKAAADAKFDSAMFAGDNQLADLREELRLVGATDEARIRALTTLKATREANLMVKDGLDPAKATAYVGMQVQIALQTQAVAAAQRRLNDELSFTADKWDLIARNVQHAAQGMADAFGGVGRSIGDMASIYANYEASRQRLIVQRNEDLKRAGQNEADINRANAKYALATATSQIGAFGDMTAAAKGFFDEKSKGYQALAAAEKVFRAVEFALSVRAMAQDAAETASKLAKGALRIAQGAAEAVVNAIKSLPFPLNLAAGAATIAALAGIGVSIAGAFGGGSNKQQPSNTGTGTVLGDSTAKSDSIKRSIDALKEVDLLTNSYSRQMAASLKSIDSQIGGVATVLVRSSALAATPGATQTGFTPDLTGKLLSGPITGWGILTKIPVIGDILGGIGSAISSLFGAKIDVTGSGVAAWKDSLGNILKNGLDLDTYNDVTRTKKTFGFTTGTQSWTDYFDQGQGFGSQFTLILKSFSDAIVAASGPLGVATDDVLNKLNGFVVDIGKVELSGLSGTEIQEKLSAVFGAVGDQLASTAFPTITKFQKVGEGAFETLVRVASTIESVTNNLDMLGLSAGNLSIDMKMALAGQFESVSAMADATSSYLQTYYTKAEQAAMMSTQFGKVFDSLGVAMPSTMEAFRQLVEAQDLTTAAGQATYATLLQLAPAFADLKTSLEGAKSAADILAEREDLQRQLLELNGDTAAIRALDLAKLDASNRALQQQVWAVQDAQAAAKAAQELKDAWTSVGTSIMDEVKRIRGLTDPTGNGSFASLMGQFNAATAAARGGDQDAAKSLPGLSQSLLTAAAQAATSRQELDRVQAQTAASLEATYAAISAITGSSSGTSTAAILAAAATSQAATTAAPTNDDLIAEIKALRDEVVQLRSENNAGHAATAGPVGAIQKKLGDVTSQSGGDAISVVAAA
ncbi:MAG TPA: phage tail length tape measure family protein [Sphingobium sp.]|uniref:phage tail length tape measure family protein n=1 Tax=Sphingobium sp. TaxID=1912891 RepID=UPI002ED4F2FB